MFYKDQAKYDLLFKTLLLTEIYTALKVPKYGVLSGPYLPVFCLNTEI